MIETIRMIANIIGHLRLCYQLLKFWVLVSFGLGDPVEPPVAQMPHGANEFWQILLHRANQSTEVLTGLHESQISTRRERVLIREFQTHLEA
jgi:hypothetical protein